MLISALDDFSQTTLDAISGNLGKLLYVSGLRQHNGEYFHWGMTRIHGEATASLAIGEAHSRLFLSLLRTPVRALWDEAGGLADEQETNVREYISRLMDRGDQLVPLELQGGGRRHFNSVLLALCCLAGVPARKIDPGA
ncbi:MAG: hypothetical protein ACXVZV_06045 [Terriglobales bacterium]